jgi:hypothetical protein
MLRVTSPCLGLQQPSPKHSYVGWSHRIELAFWGLRDWTVLHAMRTELITASTLAPTVKSKPNWLGDVRTADVTITRPTPAIADAQPTITAIRGVTTSPSGHLSGPLTHEGSLRQAIIQTPNPITAKASISKQAVPADVRRSCKIA